MTVASVAVEATKFLFGMCDCTVASDVGTGDFSARDFARVWTSARVIARVSRYGLQTSSCPINYLFNPEIV